MGDQRRPRRRHGQACERRGGRFGKLRVEGLWDVNAISRVCTPHQVIIAGQLFDCRDRMVPVSGDFCHGAVGPVVGGGVDGQPIGHLRSRLRPAITGCAATRLLACSSSRSMPKAGRATPLGIRHQGARARRRRRRSLPGLPSSPHRVTAGTGFDGLLARENGTARCGQLSPRHRPARGRSKPRDQAPPPGRN
jgi:hypothetical protein